MQGRHRPRRRGDLRGFGSLRRAPARPDAGVVRVAPPCVGVRMDGSADPAGDWVRPRVLFAVRPRTIPIISSTMSVCRSRGHAKATDDVGASVTTR